MPSFWLQVTNRRWNLTWGWEFYTTLYIVWGSSRIVPDELLHRQRSFDNDAVVPHLAPFSLIQLAHPRDRMCSLCGQCEARRCASQPQNAALRGVSSSHIQPALVHCSLCRRAALGGRVAATRQAPWLHPAVTSQRPSVGGLSRSASVHSNVHALLRQLRWDGERRSDDEGIPTEEGPLRRRRQECFKGQQFLSHFFEWVF